jgi:hypothetical protein
MKNREEYYNLIIKNFSNENTLVEFLNKEEILAKWTDEDREHFITQYLKDTGWVEVVNEEQEQEQKGKKRNARKAKVTTA